MTDPSRQLLHATCVAYEDRGVLILGAAGRGKSGLALNLMAVGCDLVADDRTIVSVTDGGLIATCPENLRGLIEARGIGILQANAIEQARVVLAVDLNQTVNERLPPDRIMSLLDHPVPVLHNAQSEHFAAAILLYLKSGKAAV